jgi:hypothetical protein
MNTLPEFTKPAQYEIRVSGRLSKRGAAWFEGMETAVYETVEPIQTVIKGFMEDQSSLHGVISRIRDLGLTLVSVYQIGQKRNDTKKRRLTRKSALI